MKFSFILFLSFINLVCTVRTPTKRIIGGWEVSPPFKYKFLVSLTKFGRHRCGGTLYFHNKVITAAHCTDGDNEDFLAHINQHDLTKMEPDTRSFKIKSRVKHPKYDFTTYEYDVAVWTLDNGVNHSRTPLISLDDGPISSSIGSVMNVVGWGVTTPGGSISNVAKETRIPIIDPQLCSNFLSSPSSHLLLPDTMLCAGFPEGGHDACASDSGGPLFFNQPHPTLVGIISWGQGCGEPNLPGIYTRISMVREWILDQL